MKGKGNKQNLIITIKGFGLEINATMAKEVFVSHYSITQVLKKYFGMTLASYFSLTRRLRAGEIREIYAPWDLLSFLTLSNKNQNSRNFNICFLW